APALRDADPEAHRARTARRARGVRAAAHARCRPEARVMKLGLTLAICSAPAVALACPVCARDGTPHIALLLGAMIAVPYAVAALTWSFVRYRRDRPALYTHGTGRSIGVVLGAVAVVLFGVDGNLFFHTIGDMHQYFWNFARAEAAPGAVRIEINAHQWSWDA